MCIFKSDKFKSQMMRDKMMVKQCGLYWTKIQTNCGYESILKIISKDVINEKSV